MINYENELKKLLNLIKEEKNNFIIYATEKDKELKDKEKELKKFEEWIIVMYKERQKWFPWLAKAYSDLLKIHDNVLELTLKNKKKSAIKSSKILEEQNKLKRSVIEKNKVLEYIISYYENIAPFLIELKEEILDENVIETNFNYEWYTKDELDDEIIKYLTIDEYKNLSDVEKNKLALERYKKRPKSKILIWKIYEQYVWQIYESLGYKVNYIWINKWVEDLWRDLICSNKDEIIVIQCKNWSKFKTIYEKHIFQFYWTVFQYKLENEWRKIKSIFYSSTKLSNLALKFWEELWIEIKENFKMDMDYPCIKCNISNKTKEKIYHLPFDQQYDKIKIDINDWDFYCSTVEEAEEKWFRRAYRYKFNK